MRRRPETKTGLWCEPHQKMHPKTAFGASKFTKSGYRYACKEALRDIRKKYDDTHKNERNRKRREKRWQQSMAGLTPKRVRRSKKEPFFFVSLQDSGEWRNYGEN